MYITTTVLPIVCPSLPTLTPSLATLASNSVDSLLATLVTSLRSVPRTRAASRRRQRAPSSRVVVGAQLPVFALSASYGVTIFEFFATNELFLSLHCSASSRTRGLCSKIFTLSLHCSANSNSENSKGFERQPRVREFALQCKLKVKKFRTPPRVLECWCCS